MPKSTEKLEERIRLARAAQWQAQLDGFTDASLKPLLQAVQQAKAEVMAELDDMRMTRPWAGLVGKDWDVERASALVDELGSLTQGIQAHLSDHISDMAGHAGSASLGIWGDILSWDGAVPFQAVALTAAQVKSLAVDTPVGGRLLSDWVNRTFDQDLIEGVKRDISVGMLKGEGYPALVDRIEEGWGMAETDAVTLARTYVQSANVGAMQSVYRANTDIVKGWRWCATLEIGGSKGGGTCLECAVLDGREFGMDEANVPEIPLHPRCRCCALPITKTWRELGLDVDEMDKTYRPYTKSLETIGTGRGGRIETLGFHQGSFSDLFPKLNREEQLAVVGPGRLGLLEGEGEKILTGEGQEIFNFWEKRLSQKEFGDMEQAISQWKAGKEYTTYFKYKDMGKEFDFSGNDILQERKRFAADGWYKDLNKFIDNSPRYDGTMYKFAHPDQVNIKNGKLVFNQKESWTKDFHGMSTFATDRGYILEIDTKGLLSAVDIEKMGLGNFEIEKEIITQKGIIFKVIKEENFFFEGMNLKKVTLNPDIISAKITFQDLVDPATGRLRLLDIQDGKVVGLKGLGADTGVGGLELKKNN